MGVIARASRASAAGLIAAMLAGCATAPADYAAGLSPQDPKWGSPDCQRMRAAAATYAAEKDKSMNLATGLLMGPYGIALVAATKENQAKRRKLFARELHLACSSQPLPPHLDFDPAALMRQG